MHIDSEQTAIFKDQVPEDSFVKDVIYIVWANKFLVITTSLLFTIAAIFYAFIQKDTFSTETAFILKTGNASSTAMSSLASLAGIQLGNNNNVDPSDYIDKVIQDRIFLTELIDKKWIYKGDSAYLDKIWHLKKDTTVANWRTLIEKSKLCYIRGKKVIGVFKDKRTNVLTLTVNMPDPQLSYDVNQFLISNIGDFIRSSLKSQAKEKKLFIEERIREVKFNMENSENDLALFKKHNMMSSSPTVILDEMRLTRQATINQEVYIQLQKQYEIVRIDEKNDQTLLQIIRNPDLPVSKSKPNRRNLIIAGFLFGCVFGIFAAYIKQWIQVNFARQIVVSSKSIE